jgi:hypothetical protein
VEVEGTYACAISMLLKQDQELNNATLQTKRTRMIRRSILQ